jgi:hypothetical protein
MAGDLAAYWKKVARAQDFHVRVMAHEGKAQAIELGKCALLRNDGQLLDFRIFSNLSLSMIVEMEGSRVLSLLDQLEELGWDVDVNPDREVLERHADEVFQGTFQLIFPEGDGELRIPVPAVPG